MRSPRGIIENMETPSCKVKHAALGRTQTVVAQSQQRLKQRRLWGAAWARLEAKQPVRPKALRTRAHARAPAKSMPARSPTRGARRANNGCIGHKPSLLGNAGREQAPLEPPQLQPTPKRRGRAWQRLVRAPPWGLPAGQPVRAAAHRVRRPEQEPAGSSRAIPCPGAYPRSCASPGTSASPPTKRWSCR
jgi:hypothetical protein